MGGWCQWSYPHSKMIYFLLLFLLMWLSEQCNDAIMAGSKSGWGEGEFKMNQEAIFLAVINEGGEFSR